MTYASNITPWRYRKKTTFNNLVKKYGKHIWYGHQALFPKPYGNSYPAGFLTFNG